MKHRSGLAVNAGRLSGYLTSNQHIAGCALGVVGPALVFAGVLAPPVGLLLAPALYAIGAFAAPARRHLAATAGFDPDEVQRSLKKLQRRTLTNVPDRIALKVTAISATITEVLPRAGVLGAGSPDLYTLVHCATDYLPTALQAYLDLPRNYADHHVVAEGKTSLALLVEQLDALAEQIDEIVLNVNRADSDKLIAHGRFLAAKFGRGPLNIDRPVSQ
jgi:hypothetical protein